MCSAAKQELTMKKHVLVKHGTSVFVHNIDEALDTAQILDEAEEYYKLPGDLKKGATIVEIGCSVGQISLWFAQRDPSCFVYAVEPLFVAYTCLLQGIIANRLNNVIPYNLAVDEQHEQLLFRCWQQNLTGAGSCYTQRLPEHFFEYTRAVTTERLISLLGVKHIDLLIVDCEGAEHDIVRSSIFDQVKVDWIVGELHENDYIRAKGHTNVATFNTIKARFPRHNFRLIEMAQ